MIYVFVWVVFYELCQKLIFDIRLTLLMMSYTEAYRKSWILHWVVLNLLFIIGIVIIYRNIKLNDRHYVLTSITIYIFFWGGGEGRFF